MNIAFFLTPKNEVVYATLNTTMRQALERMEHNSYTSIPIIDDKGKYIATLTEGDLLWKLKNTQGLSFKGTNKVLLKDIPRHVNNKSVHIDANIEDLISLAVNQNFVPVVDDKGVFIGIIKRSDIIDCCYKLLFKENKSIV